MKAAFSLITVLATTQATYGLEPGDAAPMLSVSNWVQGKPVSNIHEPNGQVDVLLFWATWSKPAVNALADMADLQSQDTKRVRIIAISNEPHTVIAKYLASSKQNGVLRFAVDAERSSFEAYMTAAGKTALPHVFVIDKTGRLAWQGHPLKVEPIVTEILTGSFEITKPEPEPQAMDGTPEESLDSAQPDETEEDDSSSFLDDLAILPIDQLQELYEQFSREQQWRTALMLNEMLLERMEDNKASSLKRDRFVMLYQHLQLLERAHKYAQAVLRGDDAGLMNDISWSLMTGGQFETLAHRFPQLAHELAEKALKLSKGEDSAILDTYARSRYLLGLVSEAIKYQELAIEKFGARIEDAKKQGAPAEAIDPMRFALEDMQATLDYYLQIRTLAGKAKS